MGNESEGRCEEYFKRIIPRPLLFFDIEVTEHCNLNCKGCESLAPLAEEEYLNLDACEKDLKKLSEISNGEVNHINILGGEPLLHPEITQFVKMTRRYFPIGRITLVTNGILTMSMDELFWDVCRENEVIFGVTRYPINLNLDEIEKYVKGKKVKFCWFGGDRRNDGWVHTIIDLEGRMNETESFLNCWNANNCTVVEHGKLFPCPKVAKIAHFNEKYRTNLHISEKDYLEIDKIKSLEEIMNFLARPIPFCRYCRPKAFYVEKWGVSKKDISEWL